MNWYSGSIAVLLQITVVTLMVALLTFRFTDIPLGDTLYYLRRWS